MPHEILDHAIWFIRRMCLNMILFVYSSLLPHYRRVISHVFRGCSWREGHRNYSLKQRVDEKVWIKQCSDKREIIYHLQYLLEGVQKLAWRKIRELRKNQKPEKICKRMDDAPQEEYVYIVYSRKTNLHGTSYRYDHVLIWYKVYLLVLQAI